MRKIPAVSSAADWNSRRRDTPSAIRQSRCLAAAEASSGTASALAQPRASVSIGSGWPNISASLHRIRSAPNISRPAAARRAAPSRRLGVPARQICSMQNRPKTAPAVRSSNAPLPCGTSRSMSSASAAPAVTSVRARLRRVPAAARGMPTPSRRTPDPPSGAAGAASCSRVSRKASHRAMRSDSAAAPIAVGAVPPCEAAALAAHTAWALRAATNRRAAPGGAPRGAGRGARWK